VTIRFFNKGLDISEIIRCHSNACKEAISGARTRHIFHKARTPSPQKAVCMHTYGIRYQHFVKLFPSTTVLLAHSRDNHETIEA